MEPSKLPKSLRRYAARIEDYSDERDGNNDNGVWVYYVPGWKSDRDPMGCLHQDHEDNITIIRECVRVAQPCDCQECVMLIRRDEERKK
jgi:hypothetical protein